MTSLPGGQRAVQSCLAVEDRRGSWLDPSVIVVGAEAHWLAGISSQVSVVLSIGRWVRVPGLGEHGRWSFGGVSFELQGSLRALRPVGEHLGLMSADAPAAAPIRVLCRSPDASAQARMDSLVGPGGAVLGAHRDGSDLLLFGHGFHAILDLCVVEAGLFSVELRVDGVMGLCHAMTCISGAMVQQMGGVVLHSVALEFPPEREVWLLFGPRDAGKTTLAAGSPDSRWLARDRVALLPLDQGLVAWGLPGGDDLPQSQALPGVRPVRGLCRVRRGDGALRWSRAEPGHAVALLRECVQWLGEDPEGQATCLSICCELVERMSVGELLGRPEGGFDRELRDQVLASER